MSLFYQAISDPTVSEILAAYGLDPDVFDALRAGLADGSRTADDDIVSGAMTVPGPGYVTSLPRAGTPGHDEALEVGQAAVRAGQVACVVLNGGMATRFGGVVKGAVEVVDGRTFLEIKLVQAERVASAFGGSVPVALMTSWATERPSRELLARCDVPGPLYFSQYVSLRLRHDGELFRTADGRVSLHGCGHGDFLVVFRTSGTLNTLRNRGVRHVVVSNVDNLAAWPDPLVIGTHIVLGRAATLEATDAAGEHGGAPVLVDRRRRHLEPSQFPPGFDRSGLLVSTNTITFDIDALDRDFDPPWLFVEKVVEGRSAVQFERAIAAGCEVMPTAVLRVPSGTANGRFLPIKTPADLEAARPAIRRLLAAADDRVPGRPWN